jgi:hypothetical protein
LRVALDHAVLEGRGLHHAILEEEVGMVGAGRDGGAEDAIERARAEREAFEEESLGADDRIHH